jgi:two-component system, NarL family, sensor histidine kinase UhpB
VILLRDLRGIRGTADVPFSALGRSVRRDEKPMSLRFRLNALVCFVLVLSLAFGSVIAYSTAVRSVRTEMRAALLVGRQTIEISIERLRTSAHPGSDLDQLVGSFAGDRHLRVWRTGPETVHAAPLAERAHFGRVPGWFVRIVGPPPRTAQIPASIGGRDYGTIGIETDPYNETVEVWNEFTDSLVAPSVFCALTVLSIYLFIGRMLRPLRRLATAMEAVGDGHYQTRVDGRLPPEFSRLRDSFNRMAARLAETDADNRRLHEQLLSLQEEERSDLARDLHDEVSPFLFAVNVDAAAAARHLADGRTRETEEHLQSIIDTVRHVQQRIRQMLGRLRPIGLADLGLAAAIENIVAFWRRRRPEIRYEVSVSRDCEGVSDVIGTTICRIVQESLSNAVRHAEAQLVSVTVEPCRDPEDGSEAIKAVIADDGRGMAGESRMGHGLTGLSERIAALRGRSSFSNRPDAGFAVIATLPLRQQSAACSLSRESLAR